MFQNRSILELLGNCFYNYKMCLYISASDFEHEQGINNFIFSNNKTKINIK